MPGSTGAFGGNIDPGGSPTRQANIAPGARSVMMPGQGGVGPGTGMNVNGVSGGGSGGGSSGNGALGGAVDSSDPERFMSSQRVPPSLRAYVRRYFQGLQGGGATTP